MVYINNLKPRKNNLIFNNYFIVNNFQIDFHIVVYYLSKNKCKIILRRLDKEEGWNNNILINIDNEIISVGSCTYNHKIVVQFQWSSQFYCLDLSNRQFVYLILPNARSTLSFLFF